METPTLADIERLARAYLKERTALDDLTEAIAEEQRKIVKTRLRAVKGCIARTSVAYDQLKAAIESNPLLFVEPRTIAVEDLKVGLRSLPDRIGVADEAGTIERIREALPDRYDMLVRTTRALDKTALKKLTNEERLQIGVWLDSQGDEVVVRINTTAIRKLTEALVKASSAALED